MFGLSATVVRAGRPGRRQHRADPALRAAGPARRDPGPSAVGAGPAARPRLHDPAGDAGWRWPSPCWSVAVWRGRRGRWTPARVGLLVVAPLAGALFFGAVFVATATVAFWWIDSGEFANAFTYGGRDFTSYPMTVYGGFFRWVFAYSLGFAFVGYYPALALLGRADPLGAARLGRLVHRRWSRWRPPGLAGRGVAVRRSALPEYGVVSTCRRCDRGARAAQGVHRHPQGRPAAPYPAHRRRGGRRRPAGRAGRAARLPRPERGRQVDHPEDAHRCAHADRR